ncbi:MAG: hypothetical protein AAB724_03390 [Patescibacteria group bacterium]
MSDKKIIAISLVLVALGAGAYFYNANGGLNFTSAKQMEEIKAKTEKFINEKLMQPGTTAAIIKSIVKENGLYKVSVDVGGQEIPAYISQDGKNFFPQVISMEAATSTADQAEPSPDQAVPKTDKPSVELFVMSYCPYGLQAEKGILPVSNLLGSKIDFQLKFVDYAMHGDKEIDENLRQYCIQKNSPGKLSAYLECFIKQDNASACLISAKIDSSSLTACVSQTDAQFKIKEKAADKSQWRTSQFPPFDIYQADNAKYGIQGSPSLVINGVSVQAARDPQSLLTLICSGFNNPPSECQQELSASAPSPGFGEGTGSASASQCEN